MHTQLNFGINIGCVPPGRTYSLCEYENKYYNCYFRITLGSSEIDLADINCMTLKATWVGLHLATPLDVGFQAKKNCAYVTYLCASTL